MACRKPWISGDLQSLQPALYDEKDKQDLPTTLVIKPWDT